MNLSIIIPLYNEEKLVLTLLQRLLDVQMPTSVRSLEIVIVDDCSSDNSYANVQEFIKDKSFIHLHRHEKNQGKGAAVRTGISRSTGNVILIQDADLELSPGDIPSLINAMDLLKVEFVNGSRYLPGVIRPISSYRRYIFNKIFTYLTSLLNNVRLTDMACGYKLFTRDIFEKIKLNENRFGFEAELLIKALRLKRNNVTEVPVNYFPRNEGEGKKLKTSDGFKIFWTIFKYGVLRMK